MSEFWTYLEALLAEAETGQAPAPMLRSRLMRDWGGASIYVPSRDPAQREAIRELRSAGISERTARRKIRGC